MNIGGYLKSIVPGLITIGYAVQAAVSDGKITGTEAAALGSLALTTVAAWLVPNTPKPAPVANVVYTPPVTVPQVTVDNPSAPVDASPLIPPDTTP